MLVAHETRQSSQEGRSATNVEPTCRSERQTCESPRAEEGPLPEAAALREGDTRMCMMGPDGALFETDYHHESNGDRMFTVLWLNADASGYMDEARGDRILAVRY